MTFAFAVFASARDRDPRQGSLPLDELVSRLTTHKRYDVAEKESLPAWSAARFAPGGTRRTADVLELSCLVLDYDDGTALEEALALWDDVAVLAYTSYSHSPERPKFRVVLPLARPIPATHWRRVWMWAFEKTKKRIDPACKDPSRLWFAPAVGAHPPIARDRTQGRTLLDVAYEALPEDRTEALPPPGWTPSAELARLPPDVLDQALERWRARLATSAEGIAALTEGRRTEIRAAAYHLARLAWLDEALPDELLASMRRAAGTRYDDNIETMLHACLRDGGDSPLTVAELVGPVALASDGGELPLIVLCDSNIWIRDVGDRTYRGPTTKTTAALKWLDDRGDVRVRGPKTGKVLEWVDVFVGARSVVASTVEDAYREADGSVRRAWDPDTGVFRSSSSAVPEVDPLEDARVARWLDAALAGAPRGVKSAVLDWLAASHALDFPAAALYVEGARRTGKSMLAHALASRWRRAPVPMVIAMRRFNVPLVGCPIVHLDEGARLSEVSTEAFRTLTSETAHTIERKGGVISTLRSALRVIVTANNPDALKLREVPTLADLDAIAERILYVHWSTKAADYLESIGGRAGTAGWVTAQDGGPGAIARHIAWMVGKRTIRPGARLLVEGIPTDYHRELVVRVHRNALVLEAVLQGILGREVAWDPVLGAAVSKDRVYDRWASWVHHERRLSRMEIAGALRALSRAAPEAGVWFVDPDVLRCAAAMHGIDLPSVAVEARALGTAH